MDVLPEYLIVESLGIFSGKYLYWARRKSDNAVVLVKQSESAHLFDNEIEQLKQEYETARLVGYKVSLHLPNAQNGYAAIIYESCNGVFLNRLLETQQLSIDDKIHLFKVVAKAVGELQKKKIMHFAIRLDRIILRDTNDDVVFFALNDSVILNDDEIYFPGVHHYPLEVLRYLPPEMTGKTCKLADLRTSFYQLGIMFYRIFTDKFPFESSEPQELLYAQAFEEPIEPKLVKPEVPEWISAIIMKLLEKDPEDRYQTAESLCADLDSVNEKKIVLGRKDRGLFKLSRKMFGYKTELEELDWYCKHLSLSETRAVFIKYEKGCGRKEFLGNFRERVNKNGGYYFDTDFSVVNSHFPFHGILILLNKIIAYIKDNDKASKFIEYLKEEKNISPYLHLFASLLPELRSIYPDDTNLKLQNIHFRHSFFNLATSILRYFTQTFGILTVYIAGLSSNMKEELKILQYILCHCSYLMFLISVSDEEKDAIEKALSFDGVFFAEMKLPVLSRAEAGEMIASSFNCDVTQTLQAADVLIRQSGGRVGVMQYILQDWYINKIISYHNGNIVFDAQLALRRFVPDLNVTKSLLEGKSSAAKSFLQLLSCYTNGTEGYRLRKTLKIENNVIYQQILDECKDFLTNRNGCIYFKYEKDRYFIYQNLSAGELKYFHALIVLDFIQSAKIEDFSFTMMDHVLATFDSLNEQQRDTLLNLFIVIIEKANLSAAFEYGFQLCSKVIELYGNETLRQNNLECHFYCMATILAFFSKNYEMMQIFFNRLNVDAYKDDYEKLKVQEFIAEYFYQVGQLDAAIDLCKSALQSLGFIVPEKVSDLMLFRERYKLKQKIKNIACLEKLPEMRKTKDILIMRYLAKLIQIVSFLRTNDAQFLSCKMVDFVLKHGKSLVSPLAFAFHGAFEFSKQCNFKNGVFFSQTALAMSEDVKDTEFVSQTIFFAIYFGGHWKMSHDQIHYWISRGASYENDYGCSNFAVVCNNLLPMYSINSGIHLKQILANANNKMIDFFNQDIGNPTVYLSRISLEVIKSLSSGTQRMWKILSDISRTPQSAKERFFTGYYYTLELFLSVVEENPDIILNKCDIEEKKFYPFYAENYLYQAILLKLAIFKGTIRKAYGMQKIRKILRILKKCRRNAAEYLEVKILLIRAIIAELKGEFLLSNGLCYEALRESLKNQNYLEAALCSLSLTKQQLRNGDKITSSVYFKKAIQIFKSLGYFGIIGYLKTRYEVQLEDDIVLSNVKVNAEDNEIVESFIKELKLIPDVQRLTRYFIKQIAFLFQTDVSFAVSFDRFGKPFVLAAEIKRKDLQFNEKTMLSDISPERIPKYLISFVYDNACTVNLNEKKWKNIISYDNYFKLAKSKNALCVPLSESRGEKQNNTTMVLYLESSPQKQVFSYESETLIRKLFETYIECRNRLKLSVDKKNYQNTKVKRLSHKLKDIRSKYKELTYLESQGILKFDLHGKITYCNSIGCKMLGLSNKALKDGFFLMQLFTSEEDKARCNTNLEKMFKFNFGGPYEYQWCNDCFVRVSWAALKNEKGKVVAGRAIFINITKQKQTEKELRELNEHQEELIAKRTQALNESLLQLRRSQNRLIQSEKMASLNNTINGISHEINTPLGVAITSTSLLTDYCRNFELLLESPDFSKEKLTDLNNKAKSSLSMISNNLASIAKMISDFKELLKQQSKSELCQFDLRDYLNMVYQTQRTRFSHIEHEFILDCPSPFLLTSYPVVFFQIISGLILNSFIHGFEKRDNCIISICVKKENDGQIKIIYKDNGCGIPKENIDKIFNPFFTTKVGQGGQGLGLYAVYNLVYQQLDGTISCDSSENIGTTFTITFPNMISNEQDKNDTK